MMLVCFGTAWPFSIVKSWRARQNAGKSIMFLYIIWLGYVAGISHKIFYSPDSVIYLYIGNCLMVMADILIYYRNRILMIKTIKKPSRVSQANQIIESGI